MKHLRDCFKFPAYHVAMGKRVSKPAGKLKPRPFKRTRRDEGPRMERGILTVFDSFEAADLADIAYWREQTPAARLRSLEDLRQWNYRYGHGEPLPRFQRTLRTAKLGEG